MLILFYKTQICLLIIKNNHCFIQFTLFKSPSFILEFFSVLIYVDARKNLYPSGLQPLFSQLSG